MRRRTNCPGSARSVASCPPTPRRYAIALLAGGTLGACTDATVHDSRAVRSVDASAPLVLGDGGRLRVDASAIVPSAGADASTAWVFLHTGQSLAAGLRADPTPRTPITGAVAGHYMLAGQQDAGGALNPTPWALTTITNPIRALGPGNAGIYPTNSWDETPMVAMAARLAAVAPSVVSVHELFAINGATVEALQPADPTGNQSFLGLSVAVREIARLVRAMGRTPRFCIVHTHGESDNGVATYIDDLGAYRSRIEQLIWRYSGGVASVPMLLTQASAAYPPTVGSMNSTWQAMVTLAQREPDRYILAGPKYALSYDPGDFHLDVTGSRDLGILLADAWLEWRRLRAFASRAPIAIARTGTTVDLRYDLAPGETLTWDASLWAGNHAVTWPEWANARGFEVLDAASNPVAVDSAALVASDTVRLTRAAGWPAGTLYVTYAHYADSDYERRRGQLRTSSGRWIPHSYHTVNP